jgi:predicted nucleic acid-binding Zn ribbon protein
MIYIIPACIIAVIIATYAYYGGFSKVNFSVSETGGELFVYEVMTGDFSQSGKYMDQVYDKLLNEDKIETFKGCGIYYDDPRKVEDKSKMKSDIGCIVEEKDREKVLQLGAKYQTKEIPRKKYIVGEFPYKGKISVFISLLKVYPALDKFTKDNGYNEDGFVMEIYDMPSKKIMYRKQISE